MTHHRVADQRELPRARCRGQRDRRAIEVRSGKASALALVAVMASGTPAVRHRQVRYAIGNHLPTKLPFDDLLGFQRAAGKFHRRQELAVGHLLQSLARTAHADVAFHAIVIRFHFFVADGPIFAVAIATGRLEFVVGVAIALARPTEGFASNLAAANPHERLVGGKGVGIFQIVDEELVAIVVACVAEALHGLVFEQALLIAEAAEFELIRPDVFGEVARGNSGRTGLEHQHAEPALRNFFGDPPAAGPGADHQNVKRSSLRKKHEADSLAKEGRSWWWWCSVFGLGCWALLRDPRS